MKGKKTLFDYIELSRMDGGAEELPAGESAGEGSENDANTMGERKRFCGIAGSESEFDGSGMHQMSDEEAGGDGKRDEGKGEERYGFLKDVRDKNGRRVGEEGYDPSSLLIPEWEYNRLSPFEKQFWDIKKDHFDTVVFFKKGKFYELYEDDALIGARLFDLKVTGRVNMKMSGFPESSLDYWSRRFLEHGYRIARVEQRESMIGKQIREKDEMGRKRGERSGKEKIIKRELKEIITQGTIYNMDYIRSVMPVYLMSVAEDEVCYSETCSGEVHMSVVLYDASVGEVYFSSFCDDREKHKIRTILSQHDVQEVIADFCLEGIPRVVPDKTACVSDRRYEFSNEREYRCFQYLLNYMERLRRGDALRDVRIGRLEDEGRTMIVDDIALRNMEIFRNSYDGGEEKTLFKAVNFCSTPFGQRLLRKWIMGPLVRREEIEERQGMAQMFKEVDTSELRRSLRGVGDGERLLTRLYNGNPRVKDLSSFIGCLDAARKAFDVLGAVVRTGSEMSEAVAEKAGGWSCKIGDILSQHRRIYDVSEAEISPGEENEDELFHLMKQKEEIEDVLNKYLEEQRARLGCGSVRFRDIGKEIFQVEVPKEVKVPPDYFMVSSTKSVSRYSSRGLRQLVGRYVECEERIFQSKGQLLRRAIDVFLPHVVFFRQVFRELAHIDCYVSFAVFSQRNRASAPVLSTRLCMSGMSSPIYPGFVASDYDARKKVLVLTGANMGGKSTLLRSICLNVILSQVGMDVCCSRMETPLFDRIFTRIGARDDLVRGESTFMVELGETASILRHSTRRSLVIMDELGRGTSTRDGECIARAVLEHLKKKECHVLFSTHYHGIIEKVDGVMNGYMGTSVVGKDIVFLYKLVAGASEESHGLYVARMAGVPDCIVSRAEKIRESLERGAR